MLYPLNALIESQKERFSEWIAPFGGRIRFGLYNGDTPSSARDADRRRTPEQVIDRAVLRANPPPILVTNPTMLEYMLVRDQDAPILKASNGKLKWIVLDEAHSLVGAAAAEIALLLRRVLLAFEVKSSDVHFVATSATIGEGEGVKKQLEIFLAEVAGIPNARVHMIEGHRRKPPRPVQRSAPDLPVDISSADPHDLYDALAGRDRVWSLVERLYTGTVPLKAFANIAAELKLQPTDLAIALSRARSRPQNRSAGDILAPLRNPCLSARHARFVELRKWRVPGCRNCLAIWQNYDGAGRTLPVVCRAGSSDRFLYHLRGAFTGRRGEGRATHYAAKCAACGRVSR